MFSVVTSHLLSRHQFFALYRVKHHEDGHLYLAKRMPMKLISWVERELKIRNTLWHDNISPLLDCVADQTGVWMLMAKLV